jgi:hypothetical protein
MVMMDREIEWRPRSLGVIEMVGRREPRIYLRNTSQKDLQFGFGLYKNKIHLFSEGDTS